MFVCCCKCVYCIVNSDFNSIICRAVDPDTCEFLWENFSHKNRKVNLQKLHCFLLLSNILCFFTTILNGFFIFKFDSDPDPHSEKLLDPNQHKMNEDPQP